MNDPCLIERNGERILQYSPLLDHEDPEVQVVKGCFEVLDQIMENYGCNEIYPFMSWLGVSRERVDEIITSLLDLGLMYEPVIGCLKINWKVDN